MEVTLEQLLSAREARTDYIRQLQQRHKNACVVVFTVVSPGPVKQSPDTKRLLDAGIQAISHIIKRYELIPLIFEAHEKPTGDEVYLVMKTEPGFLKMELCKLEDGFPYGRLWDMDVIKPGGAHVCRGDIGFDERKCLVCGKTGRACYSRQLHTPQEVQVAVQKLLEALPD